MPQYSIIIISWREMDILIITCITGLCSANISNRKNWLLCCFEEFNWFVWVEISIKCCIVLYWKIFNYCRIVLFFINFNEYKVEQIWAINLMKMTQISITTINTADFISRMLCCFLKCESWLMNAMNWTRSLPNWRRKANKFKTARSMTRTERNDSEELLIKLIDIIDVLLKSVRDHMDLRVHSTSTWNWSITTCI